MYLQLRQDLLVHIRQDLHHEVERRLNKSFNETGLDLGCALMVSRFEERQNHTSVAQKRNSRIPIDNNSASFLPASYVQGNLNKDQGTEQRA